MTAAGARRAQVMQTCASAAGVTLSWDSDGHGPPLVLVHGSFSDHRSNWDLVRPLLAERLTVHALARRGRGATSATKGHTLEDEGRDVVALLDAIETPALVVGHSYGAHVALVAASLAPCRVRRLVLYEPPQTRLASPDAVRPLEALAARGAWDAFSVAFFRDVLAMPPDEVAALRASEVWPSIVADARASLGDVRALARFDFRPERLRDLHVPVLLQVGSESPRELFVTDALAAVLPDVRIDELHGQAHEGMNTSPVAYAHSLVRFLLA
jgi:pimeloyl-ACP methyl ester carboxylesterase